MRAISPLLLTVALAGSLTFACKKVTVGSAHGGGGAASANLAASGPEETDPAKAAAELTEASNSVTVDGEADGDIASMNGGDATAEEGTDDATAADGTTTDGTTSEDGSDIKQIWNLVKYIQKNDKLKDLRKYIDPAATMIGQGEQKYFRIEGNGNVGVNPEFSQPDAAERKIVASFWMKAYAAGRPLTNAANTTGLFVDMGAESGLDKINIDMHFRYVGVDIVSKTILAGFDQTFDREFEQDASVFGVLKAKASIGGEVGMRAEFGVRRDNILHLVYTPKLNVLGRIEVGVDVVVAGQYLVGEVKLFELKSLGSGSLGWIKPSNLVYGDFGFAQNDLNLIKGSIDAVTNLLKHEVRRDPIWHPDPVATKKLPLYVRTFVRFTKPPASCKAASDGAAILMAAGMKKLFQYSAAAADEDKPVVNSDIKRLAGIYKDVKTICAK